MKTTLGATPRRFVRRQPIHFCQIFLLCWTVLLATLPGRAEAGSWIPVGAPGGNVRCLTADPRDPQRIYLGTADGILYRSDDGGVGWKRLSPGFPRRGCSLDEIVVDPQGGVFVGYWEVHGSGGGVAFSADAGRTFRTMSGIDGESVRALAIAPSDPTTLAAGTLTGVFMSHDRGQHWSRVTPAGHPDLRNMESLAFDPRDAGVLFAGTWHLAWKTPDGGVTWKPVHQGMIDDSDVMTLTVDPRNPGLIYATACSGVYRSVDGSAWAKLRGIPYSSRRTRAFAVGAQDAAQMLAGTTEGLFVSVDGGARWTRTTSKDLVVNAVLARPDGSILLGTEEAGVLRSADLGHTWVPSNSGFMERFVYRMLFDYERRRVITAVWGAPRFGGVFVSQDAGGTWTRLGTGLDGRQVLSLALQGGSILSGTDEGIFERAPEATSWKPVPVILDGKELRPRVTELVSMHGGRLLAATPNGVLRSTDGGLSWTRADLGGKADEVFDLAVRRREGELVAAATRSGIFVSHDAGDTWERVGDPLEATPHVLAFWPKNSRVLFATTSGGLYRSGDQGATWKQVGGGLPKSDLTGIALNPDGRTIYVSSFTWGGIFRSTDAGTTWSRMSTEGLGSDRVWSLTVDPETPERLLAAAAAGGLHALVLENADARAGP